MVSPNSVITLGTAGGPVANPLRAQPAHVVMNAVSMGLGMLRAQSQDL